MMKMTDSPHLPHARFLVISAVTSSKVELGVMSGKRTERNAISRSDTHSHDDETAIKGTRRRMTKGGSKPQSFN